MNISNLITEDIKTGNNGGLMMFFVLKYVHLCFFYDFTSFL